MLRVTWVERNIELDGPKFKKEGSAFRTTALLRH
jgi:hypothetical protein